MFLLIASSTANFENEAFNMNSKIVLTHADLNMDISHQSTQALRYYYVLNFELMLNNYFHYSVVKVMD